MITYPAGVTKSRIRYLSAIVKTAGKIDIDALKKFLNMSTVIPVLE